MVHILYTSIAQRLPQDIFNSYLEILSSEEQQKILRFVRWQDAQASLMGKVLLLDTFRRLGYKSPSLRGIYRDRYGKPFLPDAPAFNISHSGEYVICAASMVDVPGIDIEEVKPLSFEDFHTHFTMNEWQVIHDAENSLEAFYTHWCAKEAFIKRDGKGLSNELKRIELTGNLIKMDDVTCHIKYFNMLPGYKIALATHDRMDAEVTEFNLP